jgi:hypothetical protein
MSLQLVLFLILIVLALSEPSIIKTTQIIRKQVKNELQTKQLFNFINNGAYDDHEALNKQQLSFNPSEQPSEAPTIEPSEMPTEIPTEMPTESPSEIDQNELELHVYFRLTDVPCASNSLSLGCRNSFFHALSDVLELPVSQFELGGVSDAYADEIVLDTYISIPLRDFPEFHGNTTKLSVYFMSIISNAVSEGTLSFLLRGYARHNLETCFYQSSVSQVSFNRAIILPRNPRPTTAPTRTPSIQPSFVPTVSTTTRPTAPVVVTSSPTASPSQSPSRRPTLAPSIQPTASPSICYLIGFKATMTIIEYPYSNLTLAAEETLLEAMGNIQNTGYSNFQIVSVIPNPQNDRRVLATSSRNLKVAINVVFTMDDFPNFNGNYDQLFRNTSRRITDSVASKEMDSVIKHLSVENNAPELANATLADVVITDFQSFQPATPNSHQPASKSDGNVKFTIILSSVLGFAFLVVLVAATYYFQRLYGKNDEKNSKRLSISNKFEKQGIDGKYAIPVNVDAEESMLQDDADVESQFEGLFNYNQVYLWKPDISEDAVIINLAEDESSVAKRKLDHPKFSSKKYDLVVDEFQCLESMV